MMSAKKLSYKYQAICNLLSVTLVVSCLSACTSVSPLDKAKVNDDSSALYMANVTIRPLSWQNKNVDRGGAAIAFGYEHQSGEGDQTLLSPNVIQLQSSNGSIVTLNGTQHLRNSASAYHGHLTFSYLFNFGDHFSLEPEAGIGYDQMNLNIHSLTYGVLIDTSRNFLSVTTGITPRWNINDHFAVEGRIRYSQGIGNTSLYNPAFVYNLTKNISFAGGYAWRDQWYSGKGNRLSITIRPSDTSDIELKYVGPNLGLRITF